MKKIFCLVCLLVIACPVYSAQYVNGYMRRDGSYVSGHYRSNADSTRYNNYSTQGNYNPYNGRKGYTSPYKTNYSNYNRGYKVKNW